MSLLTPHRLMRNCKVTRRLLLHFSLLASAFQAFSISGPGTSSPYCDDRQKESGPGRTWGKREATERSAQCSGSWPSHKHEAAATRHPSGRCQFQQLKKHLFVGLNMLGLFLSLL